MCIRAVLNGFPSLTRRVGGILDAERGFCRAWAPPHHHISDLPFIHHSTHKYLPEDSQSPGFPLSSLTSDQCLHVLMLSLLRLICASFSRRHYDPRELLGDDQLVIFVSSLWLDDSCTVYVLMYYMYSNGLSQPACGRNTSICTGS